MSGLWEDIHALACYPPGRSFCSHFGQINRRWELLRSARSVLRSPQNTMLVPENSSSESPNCHLDQLYTRVIAEAFPKGLCVATAPSLLNMSFDRFFK
jgi:hypothetical protein